MLKRDVVERCTPPTQAVGNEIRRQKRPIVNCGLELELRGLRSPFVSPEHERLLLRHAEVGEVVDVLAEHRDVPVGLLQKIA